MNKLRKTFLGLSLPLLLVSCGGNENNSETDENYTAKESVGNVYLSGTVTDRGGVGIGGVMVTTGEDTTGTDENGHYAFERIRMVNERGVVKFEKEGYFAVVRTSAVADSMARLDAVMQSVEKREGVSDVVRFRSDKETTIEVGKMSVCVPANGLRYDGGDDFNGTVMASVYYLDPNAEDFAQAMPGGDMSGVTADGKSVILLSYGMAEITLRDSVGRTLQLREGKESKVSFPMPQGFKGKQHEEIPLWYFDEEKGTWIEEGTAKKDGDLYKGAIKHFSWHNLDYPWRRATIEGYVKDTNGKPLPNIRVTVSQTSGYTNSEGYYSVYVPMMTDVVVTVRPTDYAGYTDVPMHEVGGLAPEEVYRQDVVLPHYPYVCGEVRDTEGKAVYGVNVCAGPYSSTYTDWHGRYRMFVRGDEPITISAKAGLYAPDTVYKIKHISEIDGTKGYDFVVPKLYLTEGRVAHQNGERLTETVAVSIMMDGKECKVHTFGTGMYSVRHPYVSKMTATIKPEDYYECEIGTYEKSAFSYFFPTILLPNKKYVRGCVVNTCGPSLATITLETGKKGRKKATDKAYRYNKTVVSPSGCFEFAVPGGIGNENGRLTIECGGKVVKKRTGKIESDVDMGDIEICAGKEKLEPNCVYAAFEDRVVKFYISKGAHSELMKAWKENKQYWGAKAGQKSQIWYKSEETPTVYLALDFRREKGEREKVKPIIFYNMDSYEGTYGNTDKRIACMARNANGEEVYIYGEADARPKYLDEKLMNSVIERELSGKARETTYGVTEGQKYITVKIEKKETKWAEDYMKGRKKMGEKKTFKNSEGIITTLFANDNEMAALHRGADGTTITFVRREGIGSEPLFRCWKADFSNSPLRKKGVQKTEYMLRNEADIANMLMFGPLMGIRLERTDIPEEKCGCSDGGGPGAN